jgi:hypothetical protein
VHAGDVAEVFRLQADYLKAQVVAVQQQFQKFGDGAPKSTNGGAGPQRSR